MHRRMPFQIYLHVGSVSRLKGEGIQYPKSDHNKRRYKRPNVRSTMTKARAYKTLSTKTIKGEGIKDPK